MAYNLSAKLLQQKLVLQLTQEQDNQDVITALNSEWGIVR